MEGPPCRCHYPPSGNLMTTRPRSGWCFAPPSLSLALRNCDGGRLGPGRWRQWSGWANSRGLLTGEALDG